MTILDSTLQQFFLTDPLEHQQTIIALQEALVLSQDISTIGRQLSYFVIFMSDLVAHYAALRDRICLGSISIPREEYPFTAYCLGYLSAATALPIELLFEFMEVLDELAKSKILSQPNIKQMLKLLQDFPAEAEKIVKFLKGLRNGQPLDLIAFIEAHYSGHPVANQEEERLVPPSDLQNDGTMQLEDLFNGEGQQQQERRQREEEDIEFARKMQSQFDQQQPAADGEEPPCEICYVNLFEGTVETLECGHIFHKDCLVEVFRSNISNKTFPIRCPSEDCQAEIREGDLRAILSRELMQKYQQHTLKAYAEEHGDTISWCPTANCGYMFFHEKDDPQRFECLECGKEYCLNCRVEWHKDMSCKEYKISATTSEDDQKFMAFVKGKKFKQCPKCKFWVEKNEGCDHMTCKCKFEFCYKCGGVYMKCECVELARVEMENRRRMIEERRLKKVDRKKAAQARLQKKQADERRREEERRRKEEERQRREEQRPRSRRRK